MAIPVFIPIAGCALLIAGTVNAVRKSVRKDEAPKKRPVAHKPSSVPRAPVERKPVLTVEQRLEKLGLTAEEIDQQKTAAYRRNYCDGKYHRDRNAKPGSVDNPIVVGIPECSDSLQFSLEMNCWVLTDGLGNGWIR